MIGWYPWEACSFPKGNRGAVNLGEREAGRSGGRGGRGERSWDILYERRPIKKKASVTCVYLSGLTS